jgi:hypothetical protein
MSYTPNDKTVFTAAYSGIISGFAASGRWIEDTTVADYSGYAVIAGTFAIAFDEAWEINPDTVPPNTLQVFIIEKATKAIWENRFTEVTTETLTPATYTENCNAIIALVLSSSAYFAAQGITPNAWPTGGSSVVTITGGPGISVTGIPSAPIINNTGVLTLTAGSNVTLGGTTQNPVINSTSGGGTVTDVTAGTGINVASGTTTPVVTNTGVLALTAGTGITLGGTAQNPVINAPGGGGTVTDVTAGTGISVATGTTTPVVTNTGVTGLIAGVGISITGSTGNITITNTGGGASGVSSVAAGTGGVTVTGTASNPIINNTAPTQSVAAGAGITVATVGTTTTVTNAGVTSAVAGTGIGVSGATGAVTFSNTGVTSIVAGTGGITISGGTGAVTVNQTPSGPSGTSIVNNTDIRAVTTVVNVANVAITAPAGVSGKLIVVITYNFKNFNPVTVSANYGVGDNTPALTAGDSLVIPIADPTLEVSTGTCAYTYETAIGAGATKTIYATVQNTKGVLTDQFSVNIAMTVQFVQS